VSREHCGKGHEKGPEPFQAPALIFLRRQLLIG
jgi:hypothetical protein